MALSRYSDTLASDQMSQTYSGQFKAPVGQRGGRLRVASGKWTNGSDTTTIVSGVHYVTFFTLHENDRIWDMYAYGNGALASGISINVGVAQWDNETGLGDIVSADEFANGLTLPVTAAHAVSVINEAGGATVGRPLGQTIAEYTGVACTGNTWGVIAQFSSGAINVADLELGVYCYYTSGD